MDYAVGAGLALGTIAFARLAGLDRDRAFYPVMLVVVASYYDLFAVMGGDTAVLGTEVAVGFAFIVISVIGFKTNLWIVAAALAGHGVFDLLHDQLIANPGVPQWWPAFCMSFDVAAGVLLAWLLITKRVAPERPNAQTPRPAATSVA